MLVQWHAGSWINALQCFITVQYERKVFVGYPLGVPGKFYPCCCLGLDWIWNEWNYHQQNSVTFEVCATSIVTGTEWSLKQHVLSLTKLVHWPE